MMPEGNANLRQGLRSLGGKRWLWPVIIFVVLAVAFAIVNWGGFLGQPLEKAVQSDEYSYDQSGSVRFESEKLGLAKSVRPAAEVQPPATVPDRKVISTAQLEVRVESAANAADALARITKEWGGFVESSSVGLAEKGRNNADVVLRVPAAKFETFLTQAGSLGKVLKKSVEGADVTRDYVDNQARLKTWQKEEQQYLIILARATRVADVLAVQAELGRVREQIEQIQGQLKYYDYNVALATVTIRLYEGGYHSTPWLLEELKRLGSALYGSLRGLLIVLLILIPWALVGWGLWALARRIILKRKG